MRAAIILVAIVLVTSVGSAATIYVPDDHATIQAAINATVSGDTVIVRPGIYVENIVFLGKEITLKSEEGPCITIIDGNQAGSVVTCQNGESEYTVIDGFTITNGTGTYEPGYGCTYGGGMYIDSSSPTVMNCCFSGNSCDELGGGLVTRNISDSTIINCTFIGNSSSSGGGIGGGKAVKNCTFIGNSVFAYGGALAYVGTITNCTFIANKSSTYGGAIYNSGKNGATITNCTFMKNSQHAIYNNDSDPTITNCIIWKNTPSAFFNYSSNPIVTYCCVQGGYTGTGNIDADPLWADPSSDDVHLTWDSPCKDSGNNSAVTEVYDFEGDPRIADGNVDMGADEFASHLYYEGSVKPGSVLDFKIVGSPGAPAKLFKGSGILDPPQITPYGNLFLLSPFEEFDLGTVPSNGILVHSMTVPLEWVLTDLQPFQALIGPIGYPDSILTNLKVLEMGNLIYVPDDFPTIQDAINECIDNDVVIVRPGVYFENIVLIGKNISVMSERGPDETIIDGNQSGSVVSFLSGEGLDPVLEGFTLQNGSATSGAGICCTGSSPLLKNNIIRTNAASDSGGGIYCLNSSPSIVNNVVTGNSALDSGGGICIENSTNALITNNTIYKNTSSSKGGGICIKVSSELTISNSILWDNNAPEGPEMRMGGAFWPSTVSISYSDVTGGQVGVYVASGCTLNWGAGMIDADPLFVDAVNEDFHLTWDSPCKNTGDNTAGTELFDFEGDPRIAQGTVDMGADEFYYHLYHAGDVIPGAFIDVKVIGAPGMTPVTLALGSDIQDPPQSTPYGNLYLVLPPVKTFNLGGIPSTGVLFVPATVPTTWQTGEEYFFQALVGPKAPGSVLTNLMVLRVE